jgi:hypothetical protein
MKFRNNWKVKNKQWDKFDICVRLGKATVFQIEVDISRSFYMFTVLNFCIKNR